MAPVDFSGKWKIDNNRNVNFPEFLEALGKNALERKMAPKANITMEIVQDGDSMQLTMTTPKGKVEATSVVGQETEVVSPTGEKAKGTPRWEGNKLVADMTGQDGKKVKLSRELVNNEIVQTMETGGVTCTRIFVKQ